MPRFEVLSCSCEESVSRREQPTVVIDRYRPRSANSPFSPGITGKPKGQWFVVDEPIDVPNHSAHWARSSGDRIAVQMFSYTVQAANAMTLSAACLQLGWSAARTCPELLMPHDVLFIVQGDIWQTEDNKGYQIYLGFALRIGEP